MAQLTVKSPSNAEEVLKLGAKELRIGNSVELSLSDDSRFIVYQLIINAAFLPNITYILLESKISNSVDVYKPVYSYTGGVIPQSIVSESSPIVSYGLRLTIRNSSNSEDFPTIGVDYALANMMVTEPPLVEWVNPSGNLVRKEGGNEYWLTLKEKPTHILDVYTYRDGQYVSFNKSADVSRYKDYSCPPSGSYNYDPFMDTVIVSGDPSINSIYCDYVIGGCKAIVPIEAADYGPMFDVDAESINRIHEDDLQKMPQVSGFDWRVYNQHELQGGYSYWNSEYVDLVANKFSDEVSGGFKNGYRGMGTNFVRIGSAPDSFDSDVSDYRRFWIDDNGNFASKMWQTKCRGYATVVGPPNTVIPDGIRLVASKEIGYELEKTSPEFDGFVPRIPNGGIEPAPLVIKLSASTKTEFPEASGFYRKTAAFKPRLMIYLRERVKYAGSTMWKNYGDENVYGTASETTGVPYWE